MASDHDAWIKEFAERLPEARMLRLNRTEQEDGGWWNHRMTDTRRKMLSKIILLGLATDLAVRSKEAGA